MDSGIRTWAALIRHLVDTREKGTSLRLASKLGVSSGLVTQWLQGTVRTPALDKIKRLCDLYRLSYSDVLALIPPYGEAIRLAGERPKPRRPRRPAAIAGGSGRSDPLPAATVEDPISLIGRSAAWLFRALLPGPAMLPA